MYDLFASAPGWLADQPTRIVWLLLALALFPGLPLYILSLKVSWNRQDAGKPKLFSRGDGRTVRRR